MGQLHATRMVGRGAELDRLLEVAMSAAVGQTRCVLVTGEAGIGKTRLVGEAVGRLDAALVVTGHGADMATGEIPFGVVADTLRDLIRVRGAEALGPQERALLAPLLPGEGAAERDADRIGLLSSCVDLFDRLASTGPLVWVLEDLHWADAASRDVLGLVLRTVRERLLVVATVRTDDPDRSAVEEATLQTYLSSLVRLPACELLALTRLSRAEASEHLAQLLDGALPPATASRIVRLSDGVPFVVEELAAAQGRPELATAGSVASGRLAALPSEVRRLVEALAIGDGHLRVTLVEQVVDATPEELDAALVAATTMRLVVADPGQDALAFRHALLRDAVDRGMGPGARRSWHRRWAEVLEAHPQVLATDPAALAIAEHWHHAGDVRRAVQAAYAALPAAERIGTPVEQLELWRRIVEGWDARDPSTPVGALSLRDTLGRGLMAGAGGFAATTQEFLQAFPAHRLTEPERRFLHLMWRVGAHAKGDLAAVDPETLEDVLLGCDWRAEPRDHLTFCVLFTATRLPGGDPRADELLALATEVAAELASQTGAADARVMLASAISFRLQVHEGPDRAADYLATAMADLQPDHPHAVASLGGNRIWSLSVSGRHAEADSVARQAFDQIRRPEVIPGGYDHVVENATFGWLLTGAWAKARDLLERTAGLWEDDLRASNLRLTHLDLLQKGTADVRRWREHLGTPIPNGPMECGVRHVLALEAASRGDLTDMRALLAPVWEDDPLNAEDMMWQAVVDAARAEADAAILNRADQNRAEAEAEAEAEEHLATLQEMDRSYRHFGALGAAWSLDVAAQLDRFSGRDPRPRLEQVLTAWTDLGHLPDVAVTHLSLVEAHALAGDRTTARRHLAAGRELATRLGSQPWQVRAQQLVRRHGLEPGRRSAESLTDRELEVLRLVADGHTNQQIADALHMSPKTASVHVSRIITKLSADNRTEAAAIARRRAILS